MTEAPTRGHGFTPKYDWGEVAEKIRQAPNEWVELFEVSSGVIQNVRKGRVVALRQFLAEYGGSIEAVMRDSQLVTTESGTSRRGNLFVLWSPEGEVDSA